MKKNIGIIIFCLALSILSYNVGAATTIPASGVVYGNTTVQSTLDSLITKANAGDATAAQILSGKKALVNGSLITGTMTNNAAWTNTPNASGQVIIPAGYHNGSGYVDTSTVYDNGYAAGKSASTVTYKTQTLSGSTSINAFSTVDVKLTFSSLKQVVGISDISGSGSYSKIKRAYFASSTSIVLQLSNDSDSTQTFTYKVIGKGIAK